MNHKNIYLLLILLIFIIIIIVIYLVPSLNKEKFTNNCTIKMSNGIKYTTDKSNLPCKNDIYSPYASNTLDYNYVNILRILTGPKKNVFNTIGNIFTNYNKNINIIETEGSEDNILKLIQKKGDLGFCSETIFFDYVHKLGFFKNNKNKSLNFVCSLCNEFLMFIVPSKSNINSISDIKDKNIILLGDNSADYFSKIKKILGINVKSTEINTNDEERIDTIIKNKNFDGFFINSTYDTSIVNLITNKIECRFIDLSSLPVNLMKFYFPQHRLNTLDTTQFINYTKKNKNNRYISTFSSRIILIAQNNVKNEDIITFLNFLHKFIQNYRDFAINIDYPIFNKTSNDIIPGYKNKNTLQLTQKDKEKIFYKEINEDIRENDFNSPKIKSINEKSDVFTPIDEFSLQDLIATSITFPMNEGAHIFYEKLGYLTNNPNRACSLIAGKYECSDKNLDTINIKDLDVVFEDNVKYENLGLPLKLKSDIWINQTTKQKYNIKNEKDINQCCFIFDKSTQKYIDKTDNKEYTLFNLLDNSLVDQNTIENPNIINICNKDKNQNLVKNKCKDLVNYINEDDLEGYKCLGSYGFTKEICESKYFVDGTIKREGVWDKPCKYNEECPFYKKNNNYSNNRGGCIDGYCEMPVNVTPLGFRKYANKWENDNYTKPYCYNCNKNSKNSDDINNTCCESQKNPDYAFPFDNNNRWKNKDKLKKKKLGWIQHND